MKKLILTLTFIFIINLACPLSLHAQTTGLSISPPVVEALLSPNKKIIQTFEIKNEGETSKFLVNFHKITPQDTRGHVDIEPKPLDPAAIPLIVRLENADIALNQPFEVKAGARKQIVVSIEAANVETTTDAYLALVVTPDIVGQTNRSTAYPGIAGLLVTSVVTDSTLPIELEVKDFTPPLFQDNTSPLTLAPVLSNNSPVMIRAEGTVEIISPNGSSTSLKLFPHLVLGNSSRMLELSQGDPATPSPLSWDPTWKNFGPHRLRLTLTTQGGTQIQQIERVIWLLPVRATFVIILAAIAVSVLFLRKKRKKNKPTLLDTVSEKQ